MIDGVIDLALVITIREGAAKGGDGSLGKPKEPGLVDKNIDDGQGIAFVANDVVGVVSHGGDALVVGKLDNLGLLGFGCFLGNRELAAGLVMGALGGFDLEISLLGRGLGLGGGSLESGSFGSVGVGGGHG